MFLIPIIGGAIVNGMINHIVSASGEAPRDDRKLEQFLEILTVRFSRKVELAIEAAFDRERFIVIRGGIIEASNHYQSFKFDEANAQLLNNASLAAGRTMGLITAAIEHLCSNALVHYKVGPAPTFYLQTESPPSTEETYGKVKKDLEVAEGLLTVFQTIVTLHLFILLDEAARSHARLPDVVRTVNQYLNTTARLKGFIVEHQKYRAYAKTSHMLFRNTRGDINPNGDLIEEARVKLCGGNRDGGVPLVGHQFDFAFTGEIILDGSPAPGTRTSWEFLTENYLKKLPQQALLAPANLIVMRASEIGRDANQMRANVEFKSREKAWQIQLGLMIAARDRLYSQSSGSIAEAENFWHQVGQSASGVDRRERPHAVSEVFRPYMYREFELKQVPEAQKPPELEQSTWPEAKPELTCSLQ